MNFVLTQSPQIGAAKAYLLRQALSEVAKKANHTVVEQTQRGGFSDCFSDLVCQTQLILWVKKSF